MIFKSFYNLLDRLDRNLGLMLFRCWVHDEELMKSKGIFLLLLFKLLRWVFSYKYKFQYLIGKNLKSRDGEVIKKREVLKVIEKTIK